MKKNNIYITHPTEVKKKCTKEIIFCPSKYPIILFCK